MPMHLWRFPGTALAVLLGISPMVHADAAADRAALEKSAQAWVKAFNARDADALAALMTDDVVLMDPGASPVNGRQRALAALATARVRVASATKEAEIAGDTAWRTATLSYKLPNGDEVNRGPALEIWKRSNGEWRLHRQMSPSIPGLPKLRPEPRPSEPRLDKPVN